HPGIRAGGPATPTSNAARAGAATIIALTIKLDPSVGADQKSRCVSFVSKSAVHCGQVRLTDIGTYNRVLTGLLHGAVGNTCKSAPAVRLNRSVTGFGSVNGRVFFWAFTPA